MQTLRIGTNSMQSQ